VQNAVAWPAKVLLLDGAQISGRFWHLAVCCEHGACYEHLLVFACMPLLHLSFSMLKCPVVETASRDIEILGLVPINMPQSRAGLSGSRQESLRLSAMVRGPLARQQPGARL